MKGISLLIIINLFSDFLCAQIPNSGFEQWTNLQPDSWVTNSCPFCDPPWESYIVRQDSDAFDGMYNADFYSNGVLKPYAYSQFPVVYRPVKLKFYFKTLFPPCINSPGFPGDTVSARVELLYNGMIVDSGYWNTHTGNSNYVMAEIPLSGNATMFDSCRIYFEGGSVFGGCGITPSPTRFKVDALELVSDSFVCSAAFYYSKTTDTVSFYGTSNLYVPSGWQWDFGDGQAGYGQNSVHIYQDGWYYPCLTVSGTDSFGVYCTCTYCDSILITQDCIDTSMICPPPSLCCDAPLYEPVCGCDGITYDNGCQATMWYGVTKYTNGPCITNALRNEVEVKISQMPNPVHDRLSVRANFPLMAFVAIGIRNTLGNRISEQSYPGSSSFHQELSLHHLAPGIYFVEILLNGERVAVRKVIKE